MRKEVEKIVHKYLVEYLKENDDAVSQIIEKVKLSAKARIAAKLARQTVMRKSALI